MDVIYQLLIAAPLVLFVIGTPVLLAAFARR
jgi:hypothetical protein